MNTTTTFDPTQHPRAATGRFTEKAAADPGGDILGATDHCLQCGGHLDDTDGPLCSACDVPATDPKPDRRRWEYVTGRDDTRVGDRVAAYGIGVGIPNYLLGATGTVVSTNGPINAKIEFRGPLRNEHGHLIVGDGQVVTHAYPYQLLLREPRDPEQEDAAQAPSCVCARNSDGTVTAMLCPVHADVDPCLTTAQVTGKRRTGTIRNGRCTHCGHRS